MMIRYNLAFRLCNMNVVNRQTDRQTHWEGSTEAESSTHADVEVYDVVLVHMSQALTDLTQPADTMQLRVDVHLDDSRQ